MSDPMFPAPTITTVLLANGAALARSAACRTGFAVRERRNVGYTVHTCGYDNVDWAQSDALASAVGDNIPPLLYGVIGELVHDTLVRCVRLEITRKYFSRRLGRPVRRKRQVQD